MAKKKGTSKKPKKAPKNKKKTVKKKVPKKAVSKPKSSRETVSSLKKQPQSNLSQRMLQVSNHMVAFHMLISHLLRPIAGEPVAEGASLDEMSERLRTVRNSLHSALAPHPVMTQKIATSYSRVEQLWKAHQSLSPDDPQFGKVQEEARQESQKAKEACAAMSDLVAALRCLT